MCHAAGNLAVNGAAQHGVIQVFAGGILGSTRRRVVGLCGLQAGQGRGQGRIRDKALGHQCAVVVVLALGNRDLGLCSIGLQLGLAKACLGFCGIDPGNHLAACDTVTFTQLQIAQFPGNAGFDERAVHG